MNLKDYLPDYINAGNDMNITDDKCTIIFGANGVGKSSIYKNLQQQENYYFIDYDETLNSFKKSKKKIQIAANIIKMEDAEQLLAQKRAEQDIKNNLKRFGITKQGDCFTTLLAIYNQQFVDRELLITEDKFQVLKELERKTSSKFYKIIFSIKKNQIQEIEDEISILRNQYIDIIIDKANIIVSSDETTCPICDSNVSNLKEIVTKKKQQIYEREEQIVSVFSDSACNEEEVRYFIETIKSLSDDDILDYLISGGDFEEVGKINGLILENKDIIQEIESLRNEKEEVYNTLLQYKAEIEIDIRNLSTDIEIEFKNEEHIIEIILPRDVSTYSNGEINYILFNVKLYEFFGSNKRDLIVDDLLNSYDISNQYSLIFLLINMFSKNNDKRFICFTHNMNTIKIACNQNKYFCQMHILEKINCKLYLFKFDYSRFEKLINFEDDYTFFNKYTNILNERFNDNNCDYHKIFHYDDEFTIGNTVTPN